MGRKQVTEYEFVPIDAGEFALVCIKGKGFKGTDNIRPNSYLLEKVERFLESDDMVVEVLTTADIAVARATFYRVLTNTGLDDKLKFKTVKGRMFLVKAELFED